MNLFSRHLNYKVKVNVDIYKETAHLVSEYLRKIKGRLVLEVGCYTQMRNKGKLMILEELVHHFPRTIFIGIDPRINIRNLDEESKKLLNYRNLYLENLTLEEFWAKYGEKYKEQFDLIYSLNTIHLVSDLQTHIDILYTLLKRKGYLIIGWNLVGIPRMEFFPRQCPQAIINSLLQRFELIDSYVLVFSERDHYHVSLILVLEKF